MGQHVVSWLLNLIASMLRCIMHHAFVDVLKFFRLIYMCLHCLQMLKVLMCSKSLISKRSCLQQTCITGHQSRCFISALKTIYPTRCVAFRI